MENKTQDESLAAIVRDYIDNQKRARRNKNIFRIVYVSLFVFLIYSIVSAPRTLVGKEDLYGGMGDADADHVAVIKIIGPIMEGQDTSAESVGALLEEAFANEKSKAIGLEMNTPGGTPVQADQISETIIRLRQQHQDKPVYAVVSDVCASGGMYIASVADAIYANRASIVGSIGVIAAGFGFTEMMKKIGVERRVVTAGKNKAIMDPFQPFKKEAEEHTQNVLNEIHMQFIRRVQLGRGDKLAEAPDLFSGLYWTGERAQQLGLVDDFGDTRYVAREIVNLANIVEYQHHENLFDRFGENLIEALLFRLQTWLYYPLMAR